MIEKDAVKNIKRAEKEGLPARQSFAFAGDVSLSKDIPIDCVRKCERHDKEATNDTTNEKSQFSIRLIY
ncbi:hypothetical protein PspKH34_17050 [Parageobacillus sp. KH3-4]|nr:hypothetical protein PspKH34_17050 [Parageobacillus sp. KH3-4]